jgi:hypothetical protein
MIATILETTKTPELTDYCTDVFIKMKDPVLRNFAEGDVKVSLTEKTARVYIFVKEPKIIRPAYLASAYYLIIVLTLGFTSLWCLGALLLMSGEFFLTSHALYYGFIRGARKRGIKTKFTRVGVEEALSGVL